MPTIKELEQVQDEMNCLFAKRSQIELAIFAEDILPALRSLIGKTFVFRNNSDGGDRKWDTFKRIVDVVQCKNIPRATIVSEKLEINGDGRARLGIDFNLADARGDDLARCGWVPCEKSEYSANCDAVLAQLERPTDARKRLEERGY